MTGTKNEVRKGAGLAVIGVILWLLSASGTSEVSGVVQGAGMLCLIGGLVVVAVGLFRSST